MPRCLDAIQKRNPWIAIHGRLGLIASCFTSAYCLVPSSYVLFPQHCLYFFPDPHGQGSLRPTAVSDLRKGWRLLRVWPPFCPAIDAASISRRCDAVPATLAAAAAAAIAGCAVRAGALCAPAWPSTGGA